MFLSIVFNLESVCAFGTICRIFMAVSFLASAGMPAVFAGRFSHFPDGERY
jgi:hypothetical protein